MAERRIARTAPNQPATRRQPRRAISGAIDTGVQGLAYDAKGRVCGSTVRTVENLHAPRWGKTRDRDSKCRQLLAGELGMVMPKNFKLANADAFAADLPATYTRAVEQLAFFQQKRCEIKRFTTTDGQRALDTSTRLEQILEAVMMECYPWNASCDIVQNSGIAVAITQPDFTFWEEAKIPPFRDAPPKDQTEGPIKERYQRNGQGKPKDKNDKNWRLSHKQSVSAYEKEKLDWYANNIPLVTRVFGPQEVTLILGPQDRVDAAIVTSTYLRTSEISQKFIWGEDAHLSPVGAGSLNGTPNTSGSSFGTVEMKEYFGTDIDGKPYVSYTIDGLDTRYRDTNEPAVLDLSPYFDRLPVALAWGQNWSGNPDQDQRALPFMWPFYQSARQANAIATGLAVAMWWIGFPTFVTTPDPTLPGVLWDPKATPTSLDIEPLKVLQTSGPVTRLSAGEVAPDAWQFLAFLLGENEKAGPPDQARGKGDSSGFEKTISRAYAEDAQFQTLEGIRSLYEQTASFALECLSKVGKLRRPVCVYYSGPVVSPADGEKTTATRVLLELDPDLAGDQWKVKAMYPPKMSLAERQQSAELVERRLKTRLKHFEDDGDPAPERTMYLIEAEDLNASPMGQTSRWALIAKMLDDDQMAEQLKLMGDSKISPIGKLPYAVAEGFADILVKAAQAANGGAQGAVPGMQPAGGPPAGPPNPLAQGVQPGMPQGGQMTGLNSGSTAQSSLAGSIGGEMSAGPLQKAANAGGAIPTTMTPGG